MAELSVQSVIRAGLKPSYNSAASGGDEFPNDGNTFFHAKNGDASSKTVTLASQYSNPPAGTAKEDVSVSIPAGEERLIGPLPQEGYNDGNGKVQVSYDAVTSVTVAAISMGTN